MEAFLQNHGKKIIGGLILILCVLIAFYAFQQKSILATPENVKRIQDIQTPALDRFLAPYQKQKAGFSQIKADDTQKFLVNLAPLTVLQPGFIGPSYDGAYNERDGVLSALKTGARSFVLVIDYHEDPSLDRTLFGDVKEPRLLLRDDGGRICSLGTGSIQKVAQALADMAFNDTMLSRNDPLILTLYFPTVPDVQKTPREFYQYCSKVATQLNPLLPYLLTQTSVGSYNRQARQDLLLTEDHSVFEKKVLVFCNLDLTGFRNTEALRSIKLSPYSPKQDLDWWVHLRLFKETTDDSFGPTAVANENQFARGYIKYVSFYSSIPDDRVKGIVDTNRIRWIVPLGSYDSNPADVKKMMDTFGVQCIAIKLWLEDDVTKKILALWNQTGWRLKPEAIRFTKPKTVQPLRQSPQANANRGMLTVPSL